MGDRPLSQLLRHTEHGLYQELGRRAATVSRAAGTTPAAGRGRGAVRPTVASVRTSLVAADALEVSARVRHGQRSRALAARFEVQRARKEWIVYACAVSAHVRIAGEVQRLLRGDVGGRGSRKQHAGGANGVKIGMRHG